MSNLEIAITVDDLPKHGETVDSHNRFTIVCSLINVFKEFNLPSVTGFVNCGILENYSEYENIINLWLDSGNFLANHTYHHPDLRKISSSEYILDIQKNETALRKYTNIEAHKLFRYPYLLEGDTQEKLESIRNFLSRNNYMIAHVTVDYLDFLWNTPICKCIANHDQDRFEKLKQLYIRTAIQKIKSAYDISLQLFGRNIKHILLIHAGIATSLFLQDVLRAYREMGWKFIELKSALDDNVYKLKLDILSEKGPNFLHQVAQTKNIDISHFPSVPRQEIEEIVKDLTLVKL